MADTILVDSLSEPLNGATAAKVDIDTDMGNLTIDRLAGSGQEGVLASGTLEYFEKQGPPAHTLTSDNDQARLTVKAEGGTRSLFRFPWSACNGEFEWQIHLNPAVPTDITAESGGGNVKLDLTGMNITHLSADTGGGNMEVILPDNTSDLSVLAKTGAGNVTVAVGAGIRGTEAVEASSGAGNVEVRVPSGTPALIHASSGIGNVIVDPGYGRIDKETYRSSDFDTAPNRVEITAHSGAGNVSVVTR